MPSYSDKVRINQESYTFLYTLYRPHYVKFDPSDEYVNGTRVAMAGIRDRGNSVEMQCLPLYSILLSLDNPTVNYFSLDIEGAELQVKPSVKEFMKSGNLCY